MDSKSTRMPGKRRCDGSVDGNNTASYIEATTHVASAWIGNSVAVAVKHYLQATEDHFKQASKKATQNPASKARESSRNDSKTQMPSEALGSVSSSDCERLRPIMTSCNCSEIQSMGDTGLELYRNFPRNTRITKQATHNPTHRLHLTASIAPELQRVIEAWPALPARVRHGLLTIIDAVGGDLGEVHR